MCQRDARVCRLCSRLRVEGLTVMREEGRALNIWATAVPPAAPPSQGFEVLSRRMCLDLLGQAAVGRLAVSVRALPAVFLVPFALVEGGVIFPAVRGGELDLAVREAVVAFEADHIDPATGWSVVVTGIAAEVDDVEAIPLPGATRVAGWALYDRCLFRIPTAIVTGRRILRPPLYLAGPVSVAFPTVSALEPDGHDPTGISVDGGQFEPIPVDECLRLLATEEVGRLAVTLAGQPRIFPVNYALDGDAIVFRTASGTKLEATSRSLAAFEVDRLSPASGMGWSVVVEGIAEEITSADAPSLRERLAALPVRPWAPGDRLHYVRIVPLAITGSRFLPVAIPAGPNPPRPVCRG